MNANQQFAFILKFQVKNMPRAPFQVLVIPYRIKNNGSPQYLIFKRADTGEWQWIAGGGENNETPEQAARREVFEEAGISAETRLWRLDSLASIPAIHFTDRELWGEDFYVVPEYAFGFEVRETEIKSSAEHTEHLWLDYENAQNLLRWDSNRTALWELDCRLAANGNKIA